MTDILDDLLGGATGPKQEATGPKQDACCADHPVRDCTSCGRPTCQAHLWTMLGVCRRCAQDERMARFQREPVPEPANWLEGG